ncbi:Fpg/Nei family DNA glycosylase [Candidatus Palauibacter sp.]|uniref:Fpg/Nei family DNA glycosylase n=1 Tax=Candidatus Palauibacter sp. TaxID=3101350 RepID=UPI003B5A4581
MIELPDVERMIESIAGYTTGKTISTIRIDDPNVVPIESEIVTDHLEHHAVESVERHGRYVVLRFRSDYSLIFDMGDDGLLRLESQTAPPTERTRIRFQFAAGRELRFSSSGSQGTVQAVAGSQFDDKGALQNLGVDPLSEDLTVERFETLAARNHRSTVKGFLLNQKAIAGIGNDYADEICFQASVRPDMRVGQLKPDQTHRLHRYLRRVLRRATLHWSAAHSDPGWLINSRSNGSACPRCRHELTSLRVTGRKTVICPRCQRAA